ncbi:MAG: hypothetical protein Q8Q69_06900 [Nitrosopumilaceae archaeon]|jgi:hypothetical protein|nr:hypothetical protein [Nitrosopumilaceae archaeon]
MTISKGTRDFIDSLIDYYMNEAASYRQIAEGYLSDIESAHDTAFGIIVGCIYTGFIQSYTSKKKTPPLEDIQEFHKIIKEKAPYIMKSILESKTESDTKK